MNRDLARRLDKLEAKLQPVEMPVWNPWQRLLTGEEYEFVNVLHARGADCGGDRDRVSTWHDDWPAWRYLCDNERELALLAAIEGKASQAGLELWPHLHDLSL